MPEKIDRVLSRVEKPSRYIGGEVNSYKKKETGRGLMFALAFPDVYEVGMSHLGIQILYSILNENSDITAERVFAPWPDLEERLRAEGVPLCSLESRTPLSGFDVVGFSLQYELSFTNVLNMLELGGIPVRAAERSDASPIIIAGGPCCFNPAPMADFIDAFAVGEGEEAVTEIAGAVLEGKRNGLTRKEVLEKLAGIEGVYVPSLGKASRSGRGLSPTSTPGGCP